MTGIALVLWYIVWLIALTMTYAGYRFIPILSGAKKANAWGRGQAVDDPGFITRAHHAHLNALEGFPVVLGLVFAASALGRSAVVDQVAEYILAARIAQSVTHLISTAPAMVFVRAGFFLVQIALFIYVLVGLLH